MASNALPLVKPQGSFEELKSAFGKFLKSLKVLAPRELILINPPVVPEEYFDINTARNGAYFGYPPTGLLYIAAVAKEVDPSIEVKIIDLNYEVLRHGQKDPFSYKIWQKLLDEAIGSCEAPHVGITYMLGTTKEPYMEISNYVREQYPDVPILTGGVQATYDHEEILDKNLADIVFRHEGEIQFKAFLESCIAGEPVSLPLGSVFMQEGQVVQLGEPQKDVPMDWDVRPYYGQLEIENYHNVGATGFSIYNGKEKPFATVLTNRGCRARCTFCTVRDFNGFGIRQRSVRQVVDEIKFLVQEKGIKQIDFIDDDLLWNPERAIELFKAMAEEVPGLEWTSTNGLIAAAISEDVMYWMVKSGVTAFKIGIESGNDKMLHLIKKPTTKPKLREKGELFRQYPDVYVSGNFIIGFPNETFAEIMDSFDFAAELKWDWCTFNICQPLKGTDQFSSFQELGDDRCYEESYTKTLNPGRSAPTTDLEAPFRTEEEGVRTGMDVFNLPYDEVPTSAQLKEIWFTFNLVVNFLNNVNFAPGGNPAKLVKWLEAIHQGYPYDASMCAALAKGHELLGNDETEAMYRKKFQAIVSSSTYWQGRVESFPELMELAGVSSISDDDAAGDLIDPRNGAILPNVSR